MKTQHTIKHFALAVLLTTAALAPIVANAQLTVAEDRIAFPLHPDDPAAQLNPEYRFAPAMPTPNYSRIPLTAQQASREVAFDLAARQAWFSEQSAEERFTNFRFQLNNENFQPGMDAEGLVEPEPSVKSQGNAGRTFNQIIGADNRVKITSTTSYPWRTMCKLYMKFPNGKTYMGSGALVANKYVLTAGHCVHSAADGGWATKIEVIPGLNGSYKPYGSAFAVRLRSYTGWTVSQSSNHDFGLITLDRTVGNSTGWLGYGYFPSIVGVMGYIAGYPGDKDAGKCLYFHSGLILSATSYQVRYTIDTMPGQSGSGVYRFYTPPGGSNGRYVFAVHCWGSPSVNGGTRLDSNKFNSIKSWIASGL